MSQTQSFLDPLQTFIGSMLDLPAWGVKQGYGSFLTFEFGEPKLEIYERKSEPHGLRRHASVHGHWHLWIYCCHWRVTQDEVRLAWSEDDRDVIDKAASCLNGQKLVSINVTPKEGRSVFRFDLGGLLETWPYGEDVTDEQWILFAGEAVFTYRADGLYSEGSSSKVDEERDWSPFL